MLVVDGLDEDSPYARDAQRLDRQELQRLLRGSQAERDVLGLLTAARWLDRPRPSRTRGSTAEGGGRDPASAARLRPQAHSGFGRRMDRLS